MLGFIQQIFNRTKYLSLFFSLLFLLAGCAAIDISTDSDTGIEIPEDIQVERNGDYTDKEEVALYIHTFNELPGNYITKDEAERLGWKASEGNLWDVAEGKAIGGDRFYNREGSLPERGGRIYFEADINYEGGYRGPERLVYSNDGLIYFTPDHYETFILLYGDE